MGQSQEMISFPAVRVNGCRGRAERRYSVVRRVLITGIAVTAGALFGFAPAAHADSGIPADCGITVHCIVDYYYNAAKTQPAGYLALPCSGAVFASGDTNTPYYTVHEPNTC